MNRNLSKYQENALCDFAELLLSPQLRRQLVLQVVFRRKFDVLGLTIINDFNSKGRPYSFTLEIHAKQTKAEIIRTLAHEMVHVKQYMMKELNAEMTIWKNKRVDSKTIPYYQQPWEIEAFDWSDHLYEQYRTH